MYKTTYSSSLGNGASTLSIMTFSITTLNTTLNIMIFSITINSTRYSA
jgi:hypothetical protein